jgi:NAD(P)-dependent dehydrogenase (short-subunit alcohol dehydrogenase family)
VASENHASDIPRAVLITGAAKRIGRALAEDFGGRGWAVAVHYNGSIGDAEEVAANIRKAGARAVAIQADLDNAADVAALMPKAEGALGPIGCLINNASIFERDEASTATLSSWERHQAVNLRAPFFLTQAFAKQLPANKQGAVINIIDQRVWQLTPHFVSYTVSKTGLWTLTQTLAMSLAPRIRVNAIGPGPTLPSSYQSQAQFDRQQARMPLGRGATPAEICAAARFILEAPAMTGQMIALDGGQHLGAQQDAGDQEVNA